MENKTKIGVIQTKNKNEKTQTNKKTNKKKGSNGKWERQIRERKRKKY